MYVDRESAKVPVAFYSKQLQGAETRYSSQELEGYAIYSAVRHFSFYLYGKHFTIITDHLGLKNMMNKPQLLRWALTLTEFHFDIEYRSGYLNSVADSLSRCHSGNEVAKEEFAMDETSLKIEAVGADIATADTTELVTSHPKILHSSGQSKQQELNSHASGKRITESDGTIKKS